MIDNPILLLSDFMRSELPLRLDLIRGDDPSAFTRKGVITVSDLFQQMLNRKNRTQYSEVMAYYDSMNMNMPVTDKAFFTARKKVNPEAVRILSDDFIAGIYDNYDSSINKWNDLVILAVDGSKYTVPNTPENRIVFGIQEGNSTNEPAMALVSTLHDTLNNLKLDVQIDKITGSERDMASKHIDHYCDNYIQKAVFTFDRGYPSIRIIDQIIERRQYFLMRCTSTMYKKYFDQVETGECQELEMTFDRINTNEYRNDRKFRIHLLNTTFKIRFAKVVIGTDEDGGDVVEHLITNIPEKISSAEELKELYWLRWPIETSYNRLKNRMMTEEFSGYKSVLIKQDIYADAWIYNLTSLKIKEADEKKPIEQTNGEYILSRNFNKSIGVLRTYLLKTLLAEDEKERERLMTLIDDTISSSINWIKRDKRTFERKTPVNKLAMSYRRTY